MTRPNAFVIDLETGEEVTRPMTDDELATFQAFQVEAQEAAQADQDRAAARTAILNALAKAAGLNAAQVADVLGLEL